MDHQRLDELARALAAATSRRQALKLIAAGTIGALIDRRRSPSAAVVPGLVTCSSDSLAECIRQAEERALDVLDDCNDAEERICPDGSPDPRCAGGSDFWGPVQCYLSYLAVRWSFISQCHNRTGCPDGSTCVADSCVCADTRLATCNGRCTNTFSDPLHCGTCNWPCAAGWQCCGGSCLDTGSDPRNCGGCGRPGAGAPGTSHVCGKGLVCCSGRCTWAGSQDSCGECGRACTEDQKCCPKGDTFECTDLWTEQNCAYCGQRCRPGLTCCRRAGCRDLLWDRDNCGACGKRCKLPYFDACRNGRCFCRQDSDCHSCEKCADKNERGSGYCTSACEPSKCEKCLPTLANPPSAQVEMACKGCAGGTVCNAETGSCEGEGTCPGGQNCIGDFCALCP